MNKHVRDIVRDYLVEHGYDGLCDVDGGHYCNCHVDALFICLPTCVGCVAAKRAIITKENRSQCDPFEYFEDGEETLMPAEIDEDKGE